MAVRQYIGARYVTKIYSNTQDPLSAEWESGIAYEALTLVAYQNSSYLSRKDVPANIGNPEDNPEYWAMTGHYNAQIAELQNKVAEIGDLADLNTSDKTSIVNAINSTLLVLTPQMFGAKGDGVTDDTTAFQSAIDEANNINGTVFIPNGNYVVGSLTVNGCNIIGESIKGVVLRVKNGTQDPTFKTTGGRVTQPIIIQGLSITGEYNISQDNDGINLECSGLIIRDVIVTSMGGNGMVLNARAELDGTNGKGLPLPLIQNVHVSLCGDNGIKLTNCIDISLIHVDANSNSNNHTSGYSNLYVDDSSLKAVDCHFWFNQLWAANKFDYSVYINSTSASFTSCHFEEGSQGIIDIHGLYSHFTDCRFYGTDGTAAIWIDGTNHTFVGCQMAGGTDTVIGLKANLGRCNFSSCDVINSRPFIDLTGTYHDGGSNQFSVNFPAMSPFTPFIGDFNDYNTYGVFTSYSGRTITIGKHKLWNIKQADDTEYTMNASGRAKLWADNSQIPVAVEIRDPDVWESPILYYNKSNGWWITGLTPNNTYTLRLFYFNAV